MEVSFFKGGITQVIPTKTANIIGILDAIKSGFWKEKINALRACKDEESKKVLKKSLDYFTCSGTFKKREDKGIISYSGLIQVDFDNIENQETLKYRMLELINDSYVFSAFVSPRGNGIKVIVKVEPFLNKHERCFFSLIGYFFGAYCLKADTLIHAVSVPFFVSYDPNLYLNTDSKVWTLN